MNRLAILALLSIGILFTTSVAQEKGDIKPPLKDKGTAKDKVDTKKGPVAKGKIREGIPGEVDIHFLNGSTVRMIIQSEKLEIATTYGKLSVPIKDLRAIEFGLHFPEGMEEKIETAAKGLGSGDYRTREKAGAELVELGPYSYPAIIDLTHAKEPEIAQRAKELAKKMQAAHPKKDLKVTVDDKVVTKAFTIVGRIQTPIVKAKTEYFGDIELGLAKMRHPEGGRRRQPRHGIRHRRRQIRQSRAVDGYGILRRRPHPHLHHRQGPHRRLAAAGRTVPVRPERVPGHATRRRDAVRRRRPQDWHGQPAATLRHAPGQNRR